MPRRSDISSVLLIGSGPIVIGQACEFDYSGTQAVKALKEEGLRVILVNSNPATIMTDPQLADRTYVEPLNPATLEKIILAEKPDALLPTMGGQTALNVAVALHENKVLQRTGTELIGASIDAIRKAEDRGLFNETMHQIGLQTPKNALITAGKLANDRPHERRDVSLALRKAHAAIARIGFPAVIRPAFTLGGGGGGIVYNLDEMERMVVRGVNASPSGQILIDESLIGWKEFEMEVVRDCKGNGIIVCCIENIDPMGVHTGDSVTVAPSMTLTDRDYQRMRNAALAVIRAIGVDTGGANVQFALHPETGRQLVIEVNPRVSRSSALASKATGFPIARIAAKLALGYRLDEIENIITGTTPASFEPALDYVVVKIPRFSFEKFPGADAELGTTMKSVGETMAIGSCFEEALQKALCGLETGLSGVDPLLDLSRTGEKEALVQRLMQRSPEKLRLIADALRAGLTPDYIHELTRIDPWFIDRIGGIVAFEGRLRRAGADRLPAMLLEAKRMGFSDARLGALCGMDEAVMRAERIKASLRPVFHCIDSCAGEFEARTRYFYSSYEPAIDGISHCEAEPLPARKAIIIGSGPNRISQGIEFDYCCCQAAYALRSAGIAPIMINCNPETVSTDFDVSERLYFEPLTHERILDIIEREQQAGDLLGVITQFGGQTPLRLAPLLHESAIPLLGSSLDAITTTEDRGAFSRFIARLGLRQPAHASASSCEEARSKALRLGFPLLMRPSYVLGGRAMEVVHDSGELDRYLHRHVLLVSPAAPLLIDRFITQATEVDVDLVHDGTTTHICGVMEHIEEAGVHSGDSACILPPHGLDAEMVLQLKAISKKIAANLPFRGLMNIQYVIKDGLAYVIEVNPRAARTLPFVSKATGVPYACLATLVMTGRSLDSFGLREDADNGYHAVKSVVFPFAKFGGVDPMLGPEMRSTGEVMGIARDPYEALAKSLIGASLLIPRTGRVFLSIKDADKPFFAPLARRLVVMGYDIVATKGSAAYLDSQNIPNKRVMKVTQGRPHVVDAIKDGDICLIFNTTEGAQSLKDSRSIRTNALQCSVVCITTLAGAEAMVIALETLRKRPLGIVALQDLPPALADDTLLWRAMPASIPAKDR